MVFFRLKNQKKEDMKTFIANLLCCVLLACNTGEKKEISKDVEILQTWTPVEYQDGTQGNIVQIHVSGRSLRQEKPNEVVAFHVEYSDHECRLKTKDFNVPTKVLARGGRKFSFKTCGTHFVVQAS